MTASPLSPIPLVLKSREELNTMESSRIKNQDLATQIDEGELA
jgi:hypothetical protein